MGLPRDSPGARELSSVRIVALLFGLWPWRWLRSALLLVRGVRVHPSAVLAAASDRIRLATGVSVGARTRLDPARRGRIVMDAKVWLSSDVEVWSESEVRVGSGTTIQRRSSILGTVRIGRGCLVAPNVFISSRTHPFRLQPHLPIREQERLAGLSPDEAATLDKPLWIQDDCWLGANVVVSPGVTVGRGSVVGANSVVVRDVEPYSVVAGAPARLVGQRLEWRPPSLVHMERETDLVYVLSGAPVRREDGSLGGVELSVENPLHIALRAAPRVRVFFRAGNEVRIECCGESREVGPGEGTIEVEAKGSLTAGGSMTVRIELLGRTPAEVLHVLRVEVVDDLGAPTVGANT